MRGDAENIEVGTIEVKVVPSNSSPEKAQMMVVQSQKSSCFPEMFEKSSKTFWNPRFDSATLENFYQSTSLHRKLCLFQFALAFVALSCVAWAIYVGCQSLFKNHWKLFLIGLAILFLITLFFFFTSCSKLYHRIKTPTNIIFSLLLCTFTLLYFVLSPKSDMTLVALFVGCMEVIILIYTFIPMPLYICLIIGTLYSIILEILFSNLTPMNSTKFIIARIFLHLAVHLLGIHLYVITEVRQRSTFLKVGQSLKSKRSLAPERQYKQDMIHSLMPPKVAQEILSSYNDKQDDERKVPNPIGASGVITFRTFHMSKMDDVSILFADIVGFTKMSSNKSAEHLVSLLSDLFGRFDDICLRCGCEKISTLGDCYYCVSGCPEPKEEHARCCVEMGLSMCVAIKQFDEDHKEEVNMRVGVHTGTVLCGLVGQLRFKFDVWSHDVTIANSMESEGQPGRVHISEYTHKFVKEDYEVEKGEPLPDIRGHKTLIECFDKNTQQYIVQHISKEGVIDTWFIIDRRPHTIPFVKDSELQVPMAIKKAQLTEAANKDVDDRNPSAHLLTANNKESTEPLASYTTEEGGGDGDLIDCMRRCEDLKTHLSRPPIHRLTLNYLDRSIEKDFRQHVGGQGQIQAGDLGETLRTRALPTFTNLFDVLVTLVFFLLVSVACFHGLKVSVAFLVVFGISLVLQLVLLLCAALRTFKSGMEGLHRLMSCWIVHHILHLILLILPAATVYSAFSCHRTNATITPFDPLPINATSDGFMQTEATPSDRHVDVLFCTILLTSLLHLCNSTMLSSCYKNIFALIAALILIILVFTDCCHYGYSIVESNLTATTDFTTIDTTTTTLVSFTTISYPSLFSWILHPPILAYEIILIIVLLLILIFYINYDVEIGYRLYYNGELQVIKDEKKILKEKEQADWLLHNIVPEHVANELKNNKSYCENHKDVGVIFAKISNFDDFYDESYEGGKEYLRVLNELMGDFEELFALPQFKDVEKIKTIGSCLMAASGLNKAARQQNKDPIAHLYALVDFAVAINEKVESFNKDIFNFDFEMKIGFNSGEVTAGVIGTEKLLYDIWGDTVNIASRMYSTGEHDKVQVTEDMAKKLAGKFDFEYRGKTLVKGKGDMSTYLLVKKKAGAKWE